MRRLSSLVVVVAGALVGWFAGARGPLGIGAQEGTPALKGERLRARLCVLTAWAVCATFPSELRQSQHSGSARRTSTLAPSVA